MKQIKRVIGGFMFVLLMVGISALDSCGERPAHQCKSTYREASDLDLVEEVKEN